MGDRVKKKSNKRHSGEVRGRGVGREERKRKQKREERGELKRDDWGPAFDWGEYFNYNNTIDGGKLRWDLQFSFFFSFKSPARGDEDSYTLGEMDLFTFMSSNRVGGTCCGRGFLFFFQLFFVFFVFLSLFQYLFAFIFNTQIMSLYL